MDFYNRLNYSLGNEDWSVESQALRVNPGDQVICVTASGDRPLHLLMTECSKITSIDMNAIQTYLLELKLAALTQLDYQKYLDFLGCTSTKHRITVYQSLKSYLSKEAETYWNKNLKMIHRGVIYQGMVEKLTKIVAMGFKCIKSKDINTLFAFTDLEEQKQFVNQRWNSRLLKNVFCTALNPKMMNFILDDPGLISQIDPHIQPGEYIYQRMLSYLNHHLANKSALLQLLFTGKVTPDAYFPYLTYEGYKLIRNNVARLEFRTANIIHTLQRYPNEQFDCFSLSDIASYMPQDIFENLLHAMITSAKPKARFCMRKLMSEHYIPPHISRNFHQDSVLEQKLENEESNFVYRFMVGEIQKN